MDPITIRPATVEDSALMLRFITELAVFEKAEDRLEITEERIRESIFGADATAHAIVCLLDGKPIGFAVYFYNYSTWLGKNGLYLEDVYIAKAHRRLGAGKAILKYLAQLAVSKGCGRFEWCVLTWNKPAIAFYRSIGARPQDEWQIYRLSGAALRAFARDDPVTDTSAG